MLTSPVATSRVSGVLVVGNRADDVSTFERRRPQPFETFAGHASILLENDRVDPRPAHD